MANYFVGISHGAGVVICQQCTWTVTGERIADLLKKHFPDVFKICGVPVRGSMFLQDGNTRQNNKVARLAWQGLGCEMFAIPARSPDLNPIENVFHLVRKQLRLDTVQKKIRHENY